MFTGGAARRDSVERAMTPNPPLDAAELRAPGRATGAPPTTSRSARSTCSPTRCCASRSRLEHVKPRLLGHWGTTPGLNFIYAHLNRAIRQRRAGDALRDRPRPRRPGARGQHVARGLLHRALSGDHAGRARACERLFRQFSFPGGIPSHVAPETPGSIHEGGELGYALTHAYGAAFDNPDLVVCCVVGDGEAETGPLAASWHSNKFLDPRPRRRGAAGAASQRLQDRQPDGARADPRGGAARAARGLRPRAAVRDGRRPGSDAPGDGRGARRRARRDPRGAGSARAVATRSGRAGR